MKRESTISLICFLLSGASGLIYQICWIRRAAQLFGSTTHAVSTVIALFFLGLSLGSWFFGRFAMRTRRPLRLYGQIELAIGVLAFASLFLFDAMSAAFTPVYRSLSGHPVALLSARALLVAVIILPPTIGMGGTLPLFCRYFVATQSDLNWKVGALYAWNTLGAAAGTFATGFLLLPALGLRMSILIGTGISIAVGIVVLSLPSSRAVMERVTQPIRSKPSADFRYFAIAALFFNTGFVALALEVNWVRFLALLVHNSVYTYTITLGAILLGIVPGSLLAGTLLNRRDSRAFWFGMLQILTALCVALLIALPPSIWHAIGHEAWVCLLALLPASVLSGASFPLAVRMVSDEPELAGLNVGRLGAVNIAGGILGSLLTGWFGLQALGLALCFSAVTVIALATGLVVWFTLAPTTPLRSRALMALPAVALWSGALWVAHERVPRAFLGEHVIAWREGLGSNLAVLERDGVLNFEIDRWWQGSNLKTHQIMAAHLPALLQEHPGRVLVVGAGTGQTPERFLMHGIDRLDCVDIEPAVFGFIHEHFEADWMDDPRTRLINEDGRNYLRHSEATYDIISLEVGQIFRPGVAYFYTVDFYRMASRRLNEDGLLVQFLPLPFFSLEQFQNTLRTFTEVFPGATLWYNTSELLLIGARGGPPDINATALASRLSRPGVRDDLEFNYWGGPQYSLNQPDNLLGGFLMGPAELQRFCQTGSPLTDDRPRLDYETRFADAARSDESPLVEAIARHLSPIQFVHPADPERAGLVRKQNLADMKARVFLRRVEPLRDTGDYARITELLESALRLNVQNATANRLMGDTLLHQERAGSALDFYDAALALRADDARARYGRAVALHRLGRIEEAIPEYRAAIAARPDDAEYHNNLGAALGQSGRLEEAARSFEEALRLRPEFTSARDNLDQTRAAQRRQL